MLAIGAFVDFYLGRRSAENSRARHDMGTVWGGRRGYRDR